MSKITVLKITLNNKLLILLEMLIILSAVSFSAATAVYAAEKDRIDLEQINIQGASELPKVLYIVPWKRAEIDNSPVEVDSMVDEVMMPIDREVLRRKIDYFEQGVFGE